MKRLRVWWWYSLEWVAWWFYRPWARRQDPNADPDPLDYHRPCFAFYWGIVARMWDAHDADR